MSVVTVKSDLTMISLEAHRPYAEALASLRKLRDERAPMEAALQEATRVASEADAQATTAEAAAMIGEGDAKTAQATRARFETAQAKVIDAQRRLRSLTEAVNLTEKKVAALLPQAKEHVRHVARALHQPVMQRAVRALRDAAEAIQEHQTILMTVDRAFGGNPSVIAQPRFPEITFDMKQGGALIYGTVDNILRELREAGYDVD